jgi:hypothetical protein
MLGEVPKVKNEFLSFGVVDKSWELESHLTLINLTPCFSFKNVNNL